jgi:hypothetical protein
MSIENGQPTVEDVTRDESAENENLTEVSVPEDDAKKWRTPGFQRMRIEWKGEDRPIVDRVKAVVESKLYTEFADAYALIYEVFELVRNETGHDAAGNPIWERDTAGNFVEDFSKLTLKQKEHFMFALTTRLFLWQQQAADAWGEAMFAKAQWEERFSIGYDAGKGGTIEGRTAKGRIDAREERYFGVLLSLYSRKADALVKSLELLTQRLKDSMTS